MKVFERYPLFRYRVLKINPITNEAVVQRTSKRTFLFERGVCECFHRDWAYVCSAYRFKPHSRFTASVVTYFTDRPFKYDHRTDTVRHRYSPKPSPIVLNYYLTYHHLLIANQKQQS